MKDEPNINNKKRNSMWIIDESKCLSISEVVKLRKYCQRMKVSGLKNKKFTQVRNWFMIELGLFAGLRVEEMASLKHKDLFIDDDRSSLSVIGKGNKKRLVLISSDFKRTCQEYNHYKESFGYTTDEDSFVLINLKNNKISKRALQKFFKEIIRNAALPERYYIHCLRHTYTTFLLRVSNNNYRLAQKQLGHSSIRTTQVYAGIVETEARKSIENLYK